MGSRTMGGPTESTSFNQPEIAQHLLTQHMDGDFFAQSEMNTDERRE